MALTSEELLQEAENDTVFTNTDKKEPGLMFSLKLAKLDSNGKPVTKEGKTIIEVIDLFVSVSKDLKPRWNEIRNRLADKTAQIELKVWYPKGTREVTADEDEVVF
ncbi:hypothetical protein FACS189487_05410 [Campylobacterota bacterium]|nr:hypothetical protein FACS189487_05410 [Campylobacterota bacterium]